MKKLYTILFASLFLSCSFITYDIPIINETSETLSIIVYGESTIYEIAPGQTIYVNSKIKTPKITFLTNKRVYADYNYENGGAIIKDMPYWDIYFYNSTNYTVVLYEKNDLLGNVGEVLTIASNNTLPSKLYTQTPIFEVKKQNSDYLFNYTINIENNVYYCNIH